MPLIKAANTIIGLLVMSIMANMWSNYLQELHENDMWFSNIEVSQKVYLLFRCMKDSFFRRGLFE